MPRPRHEARDRHRERRRTIRRRREETFKRAFVLGIRRAFEHYGFRISTRGTFFEAFKEALNEEIKRAFHKEINRLREEIEETTEKLSLLRDVIRLRALIVFKVRHQYIFRNKREVYTYDKLLMDLPEDVRNTVVSILEEVSAGKGLRPEIIQALPVIRHFLLLFIAYYSKFPCKHRSYAIKLTPATIHFMKGLSVTYYTLRWAPAKEVKADPYLGRTRPVDFYVTFIRYKYDEDLWNAMIIAGTGTNDLNDKVALSRDHMRRSEYVVNLRRAILQPHWVKQAMAKMMGKPELATTLSHCSVYAIVRRRTRTVDLIQTGDRRLMGKRSRHRIKDILYYKGLRI